MRRYGSCLLLVLVGAAVLRISLLSDLYLRYVQAALRPYLVVSGVLLVLLGTAMAAVRRTEREAPKEDAHGDAHETGHEAAYGDAREAGYEDERGDTREAAYGEARETAREAAYEAAYGDVRGAAYEDAHSDAHGDAHGHGHGAAGPRVAWLLTLPALALLLFPPPALGSYSAGREAAQRAAQGVGAFPALPAGDPVELTVGEFGSRAVYDSGHSLKGRTVRMTGFVTHGDDGTWYVTRLLVTCCAADATTSKAEVRGAADGAPPVDTWVTVTGTWYPKGKLGTDGAWPPVVDASEVRHVKEPADPYEKR
ncbi:TIGR03943 family putative permease subunit [Streptomyces sp. NPDC005374]|uniref:TIGR03943 family putative permease subunit n=1 Tax=Streptomyces sp. NPDC005374 TaxID=3364713 RepID=UPI0036A9E74C